ncbi:MAG: type IV toxin-antitoxin system AbiEi family antitoxin domain-containing protein [Elusimicrobia bacterium]|nr:type IV toxin-antitoxin system AbiEi family antitoxin domain-containing protein [Elusimicrobiota bacterium]
MKWFEIDRRLACSGLRMFTGREFRHIAGVGEVAAKFLLMRYARRGLLRRLKRGLYAAAARPPSSWAAANRVYRPSYISLESALSYYGMIPETVYSVTSATTRSTREFDVQGMGYVYRTIKKAAFAGYRAVEINGETVLVAEREKALADTLYLAFLRKEPLNSRLDFSLAERGRLLAYLKGFKHPGLVERFENDIKIPDRRAAR